MEFIIYRYIWCHSCKSWVRKQLSSLFQTERIHFQSKPPVTSCLHYVRANLNCEIGKIERGDSGPLKMTDCNLRQFGVSYRNRTERFVLLCPVLFFTAVFDEKGE